MDTLDSVSVELTGEQKQVLHSLLKFNKRVQTLGGYAGTGKTTVISHLSRLLPNFAVCAFTGKAANILRKKGLPSAQTIHSLIYKAVDYGGRTVWVLKHPSDLLCEGFIVDEASMVSKEIHQDLLSFCRPIIFVGDHGQLEPVGQDVFLMQNPDYKLEQIHRNAGEIAHFAEWLRMGKPTLDFKKQPEYEGKIKFLTNRQAIPHMASVDQIICAFNKTRVGLNFQVREVKGFKGDEPQVGDKVMCLRNNRMKGLFNGMQGTVEWVANSRFGSPKMEFLSDGNAYQVFYDPSQFNKEKYDFSPNHDDPDPFDFADAITCHKSQGDEWNRIMVFEQFCSKWDHKRWTYTAASRAREEILWVI